MPKEPTIEYDEAPLSDGEAAGALMDPHRDEADEEEVTTLWTLCDLI
jgi:hypothetical protein